MIQEHWQKPSLDIIWVCPCVYECLGGRCIIFIQKWQAHSCVPVKLQPILISVFFINTEEDDLKTN